MGTAFRIFIL